MVIVEERSKWTIKNKNWIKKSPIPWIRLNVRR